ncbi:RusA family crossover junction endodeoxyribonuclease [Brevundimonas sp.]|uniref:RusA family crossover junction endodeoxyribonuclease n=1 Tax=Brevundimonas sp. TaxID=1871086 RepID=UPI0025C3B3EB|nr:RusA family crossover junction endodeoxyribonuclease [Brevundimonas sp.]
MVASDLEVRQQGGAARAAPPCTTLTIPAPPSVNGLFANSKRGRFKTPAYKAWIAEAAWTIREQYPDPVAGRVVVIIGVERASLMADIDNRCKAVLDLLVKAKVIDDDRWVTGIALAWLPQGRRRTAQCRIAIMPAIPLDISFHPSPDGATGGWFINAPEGEE